MSSSTREQPNDDQGTPAEPGVYGEGSLGILPFARLGLRLLGLMLLVDGAATMTGGAIQSLFQARAFQAAGYAYTFDPHSAGWMASGIPYVLGGLYLAFDGRWVLANVLTTRRRAAEEAEFPE